MKSLIYSALIGSLAFALSAQAAKDKSHEKKAPPGQAKVEKTAKAPKAHGNPHAAQAHQQAQVNQNRAKAAAIGHQNQVHAQAVQQRNNAKVEAHNAQLQRSQVAAVNNAQQNAVAQRNAVQVQRSQQIAAVNAQQNAAVQQNIAVNRAVNRSRQAAIVNNWQGSNYSGADYSAFRNYRRQVRDRSYYHSHYPRIVLFGGGNYYWDNGYWYPAWGYNSGYHYSYDGPIYGYNNYTPDQVVINVQRRLQDAGYYGGSIDGSIGPITRRAIANYQADHGLAITSTIDRPTLARLGMV